MFGVEQSESTKALAAAIVKAQAKGLNAIFDAQNEVARGTKVPYATLASVWTVIREKITSEGIAVYQFPCYEFELGVLYLTTEIQHAESGEWRRSSLACKPINLTPQAVGGAITYLKRYSLCAMLGIVAEEDDDGASNVFRSPQPAPARQSFTGPAVLTSQGAPAPPAPPKPPAKEPEWKCSEALKKTFSAILKRARAVGLADGMIKNELVKSKSFPSGDWTAYGDDLMKRAIFTLEDVVMEKEETLARQEE